MTNEITRKEIGTLSSSCPKLGRVRELHGGEEASGSDPWVDFLGGFLLGFYTLGSVSRHGLYLQNMV